MPMVLAEIGYLLFPSFGPDCQIWTGPTLLPNLGYILAILPYIAGGRAQNFVLRWRIKPVTSKTNANEAHAQDVSILTTSIENLGAIIGIIWHLNEIFRR
jgi:hypothetical protein